MKRIKTHNQFVERMAVVNPDLTILGEYVNTEVGILVIDMDGIEYLVQPESLLHGFKMLFRKSINKTFAFKVLANKKHNDFFNYDLVDYVDSKTKVKIICPAHGEFLLAPNKHLYGRGCPTCGDNRKRQFNKENSIGWSYATWRDAGEKSKNFDSFKVYIIECWNDEECFYKIGKTFKSVGRRFDSGNNVIMPYNYKALKIIEGSSLYISNLEHELKILHKEFKHKPRISFHGENECFSKIIDINNI